ncbi:MAG: hypothetical protein DMG41_19910 [Acidobacteria bacterium]|nr:MAG: hypothetical protein AUH13_23030 [Acidobacteria bacterium 13_2_20CM_58_27]PYT86410.1 MAG: hypothetical protein DMG41_19910 [Acidobacteriota bacterium]
MRTASRFVLLLCTATMLYPQTPVRQPRFALEISEAEDGFPPHFVIVPEGGVDSTFRGHPFLHPLRGHDIRDSEKPSAIKLVCKVDGDAVEITASVFFGPLGKTDDTPLSLQGHPQQKIGTYSPHLNESIVLHEMEQLGLQPWTIKIVNAQLPNPGTLPTVNEVPSIQPEILGVDRNGYRIALRNLSSQPVSAFLVEESFDHNSNFQEGNDRGVLIAPHASHEFRLFCDTSTSASLSGIAPKPAPCAFILKAALFADGSYEGDPSAAATLAARSIAAQFSSRRVHELIDNILSDAALDDASKLTRLRSELPRLSEEPDPAILEQIQRRFPGLPAAGLGSVKASINSALAPEKQRALLALEEFEKLPKQGSSNISLAQWWRAWERNE